MLVTLGGRHLLDGLVAAAPSKHAKKLVRGSGEDCEGSCARPAGIAKSNSSWSVSLSYHTGWVGSCGVHCGRGESPLSSRTTWVLGVSVEDVGDIPLSRRTTGVGRHNED